MINGIFVLADRSCSTTTVTKNATAENSIPARAEGTTSPIIAPIKQLNAQTLWHIK